MRKPRKPNFHPVWKLHEAIRKKVDALWPDKLELHAEPSKDLSKPAPELDSRYIEQIKAGLTYYCVQDFVFPEGPNSNIETPIFIGKFPPNLGRVGENGLPSLRNILWSPGHTGLQPVAMRTCVDVVHYQQIGGGLDAIFPSLLTQKWMIRYKLRQPIKTPTEFQKRFCGSLLYYYGDYPSRISEGMVPEIKFLLGVGVSDLLDPPSYAFKCAFHRKTSRLISEWSRENHSSRTSPSLEWVRVRLGETVDDGYATRYRRALISRLSL